MSADLLAAFGDHGIEDADTTAAHTKQRQEDPGKLASVPLTIEDTWQPWPTHTIVPTSPGRKLVSDGHTWGTDWEHDNVLFDAERFEPEGVSKHDDDDDFGDFEQSSPTVSQSNTVAEIQSQHLSDNLLDLDNHETGDNNMFVGNTQFKSARPTKSTPVYNTSRAQNDPALDLVGIDEDWGAFEDVPWSVNPSAATGWQPSVKHSTTSKTHAQRTPVRLRALTKPSRQDAMNTGNNDPDAWDEFQFDETESEAVPHSTSNQQTQRQPDTSTVPQPKHNERPVNVPPPAVLLNLLPKVFSALSAGSQCQSTSPDLGLHIAEAYRVCARIIAGRSLRWKRDNNLAQSMRIGAAGRSGGMKLTAIDKGESRREDQEAEEAIASWSRLSHRLNAAMVRFKVQKPPMSLSTTLAARMATGPDVLSAQHPCPTCGLKRNERINGIDVKVSDTFGEFWIEHWGHKDCYDFWYRYNELLDHR
ncbi:hypothetical protein LTR64_004022 [Lithohypha guttulata]|uniref:uncharacterized protein n=1 Tax=Lithohypha guttulata TaxID=1690604 RepID=UPI00315DB028